MNERLLSKVLIVPAVIVFVVLATLLYRWSNQVSQATSVRLADSLQMSMVNWHLNLFRELADVAVALRPEPGRPDVPDQYARRLEGWKVASPYPTLVGHLYLLNPTGGPAPLTFRLEEESGRFEPFPGPPVLEHIRPLMDRIPSESAFPDRLPFPGGAAGWLFEAGTPALIRPLEPESGSWLVVELDRATIEDRILPDLARRYFMGVDGLDYLVAVVSGDEPRKVIYTSDAGFGSEEVADADGRMDVFGNLTAQTTGSPVHVFHELSEDSRVTGLAASIGTSWFPLVEESAGPSGWQLIVRHRRGGALGAFVAEMHRRDLAISFGALSLLGLAVAMLILTSLRANRLGRLQMDFVTAVSHELRSPLTIIGSAAENITQGVVGGRKQIAQYGAVIESQTRRLSRLVEQILLFAATRENRHRYQMRALEVREIIDRALEETSDLIAATGFTLDCQIPGDLPGIRGDLAALSQCLQNLITNSLKYGGPDRWIGICAVPVGEVPGVADGVEIRVTDHGMGIEPSELPHVFEPFYRSSRASAARISGTGLGLSLARNIAEAMQGQLSVSSVPAVGTTFALLLPCAPPPAF